MRNPPEELVKRNFIKLQNKRNLTTPNTIFITKLHNKRNLTTLNKVFQNQNKKSQAIVALSTKNKLKKNYTRLGCDARPKNW